MARYWDGYNAAIEKVQKQTLEEDLDLIDALFGRDNLKYGDTPEQVKEEALRQLEREWRIPAVYSDPMSLQYNPSLWQTKVGD